MTATVLEAALNKAERVALDDYPPGLNMRQLKRMRTGVWLGALGIFVGLAMLASQRAHPEVGFLSIAGGLIYMVTAYRSCVLFELRDAAWRLVLHKLPTANQPHQHATHIAAMRLMFLGHLMPLSTAEDLENCKDQAIDIGRLQMMVEAAQVLQNNLCKALNARIKDNNLFALGITLSLASDEQAAGIAKGVLNTPEVLTALQALEAWMAQPEYPRNWFAQQA